MLTNGIIFSQSPTSLLEVSLKDMLLSVPVFENMEIRRIPSDKATAPIGDNDYCILILVNMNQFLDELRYILHQQNGKLKFLIIAIQDIDFYEIKEILQYVKHAVFADYRLRMEELTDMLETAHQRDYVFCRFTQSKINDQLFDTPREKVLSLTEKERQIIDLAAKGYSIIETAKAMKFSNNTISAYRTRIMKRFGATSMTHLLYMINEQEKG